MIHTGFKKPVIDHTHYRLGLGQVPSVILKESGNWEDNLPAFEPQSKDGFDTFNCTGFGTASHIEDLLSYLVQENKFSVDLIKWFIDNKYIKRVDKENLKPITVQEVLLEPLSFYFDIADRWIGIISGTSVKSGGNDPQTVYEAVRNNGLIPESMLPFDDTITTPEEYYSFKGADKEACYALAEVFKEKIDFLHEWTFLPDQPMEEKLNNIKVALKYSPLAIAVYAWATDERGVYVAIGEPNHWTVMYNCDQFQRIFDTYEPFKKALEQDLVYCKRIYIAEKKSPVVTKSVWQDFLEWLLKLLNTFKW